ncbi:rhomboid family intramembrane serine protease [Verrucomicrobiales bacterium]|mgnify:CR=1 FL=1|nr:rhomboid family intramembrane serine protease [Verrucomicrobiales bacterium]MDC0276574.1 rhomboid family intramembrane serine protease [Verrucomicrobiales bacterium]MDC0314226.1 rhomboid family intramembrane serine protease [bacterium]
MGIYNRDYMRDGGGSGPQITGPKNWSALTWLVVINVTVYIAQHWFIQGNLQPGEFPWGGITKDTVLKGHVHTILTHFFIHADGMHLIFNMIMLIIFGRILQKKIGPKSFLRLYFFAGIVSGLVALGIHWSQGINMVGASGAVMAIAIATCFSFGNESVRLLFPPISVKMKYIGLALIALDLVRLIFMLVSGKPATSSDGAGIGVVAHLIGALIGFCFTKISIDFSKTSRPKASKKKKKKPLSKGVDEILDKISAEGFQSLSKEEKRILDERSEELSDNGR